MRDEAFLNWRFCEHPSRSYRAFGVRDASGILRGIAICRIARFLTPEPGLVVMEWLVPPDELEVGEALRDACLAYGRQAGASHATTIFPEWSPWFARFQEWHWLVHPTDYLMSGRNNDPRYDMTWLRDHWWYQLTEMDLL